MHRAFWIVGPLLAVALFVSVAAAFYWGGNGGWGGHSETVQVIGSGGVDASGHTVEVVRSDPGFHRHWAFFPFFFIGPLFGLLFIFFICRVLFFGGSWRRHHRYEFAHEAWHHHDGGGGPPASNGASFEEWHRKQHQANGQNGDKPGNPSDS